MINKVYILIVSLCFICISSLKAQFTSDTLTINADKLHIDTINNRNYHNYKITGILKQSTFNLFQQSSGGKVNSYIQSIDLSDAIITDSVSLNNVFYYYSSLQSISLPIVGREYITDMKRAFMGSGIKKLDLKGCVSIKDVSDICRAAPAIEKIDLSDCSQIENMTLSFLSASKLTEVIFPENAPNLSKLTHTFYGTKVKNIILPKTVNEECTMSHTFVACSQLESVTLPLSLSKLYDGMFHDCPKLVEILYNGNNFLQSDTHQFYSSASKEKSSTQAGSIVLWVKYGNVQQYKADSFWGKVKDISPLSSSGEKLFPKTLTVTNSEDANTVAKAPEGSFRKILSQAAEGDTIVFDLSLRKDTIYIGKYISHNKDVTIKGNGITIYGKSSQSLDLESMLSGSIENINFCGKMYLSINSVENAIVRNCTFNNCVSNGINIQSSKSRDAYALIEGCHFSNIGSFHGGAIMMVNNMVAQHLTVDIVSCTFVDNVLQALRTEEQEGIAINAFQYETLESIVPTIRIANCVFKNNTTHNEENEWGINHNNPVISAKDLTSLGYNVIEGKVLSADEWQKHATDVISEDIGEVYKLENDICKVARSGNAYNNFPANTTIADIEMPQYDVLGSKIDYTKASHSGAIQLTYTSDDATSQLIDEDGKTVDLTKTYLIPQGDNNSALTLVIETTMPDAKVFINDKEIVGKELKVDISEPNVQEFTFKIISADGTNTESYTLKVEKRFNFDDIVITRWNNTLIVNANNTTNGGFDFSGYKWYKDNAEVGTGQYYSAGSKKTDLLSGNYYLELTTKDGQVLRTWEKNIALKSSMVMKAYPNPLRAGETVSVELDIDPELLNQASIEIYNINGNSVSKTKAMGNITSVVMPSATGMYMLKVRAGDFVREEKLIVK